MCDADYDLNLTGSADSDPVLADLCFTPETAISASKIVATVDHSLRATICRNGVGSVD